ncbi:MAG: proton-conducting transporter transmembrane domain-containing protein, partial [Anaerolineae bacterium]
MTAIEVAVLISPELVLLLGIAVVLVLDLALRSERRALLPYAALAAVLLSFLAAALLWGREEVLFSGMLSVDPFAVYFKLLALGATALVILGAKGMIARRADRQGEFYLLLMFACLASMLATAAGDLLSLYLAFEFLSLSSYVLVAYLRGSGISGEAGVKYFLYGAVTSAVMLYGISLLY